MKRKIEETVAENEFDSKESEEIDGKGINFKRKFEHVDGNWPSHVFISIGKLQKIQITFEINIIDHRKT
jgi:hypothetical protein